MKTSPRIWLKTLAVIGGAFVAAAAFAPRAEAIEYPWCVYYGFDQGGHNCGFVTFEQCLATAHGAGGTCSQNPLYQASAAPGSGQRARYRQRQQY
jgi:Protein of unknown function (DUF3551)